MQNSHNPQKFSPDLPEPTESQVKDILKLTEDKYGIAVPKSDAKKLAKLITELNWWVKLDEGSSHDTKQVSKERVAELKEMMAKDFGREITMSEAEDLGRGLLMLVPLKEKQRISDEIRAILVTHREVVPDSAIEERTAKLFKLQYDIELTKDQLWQVIRYLSQTFWYEEGLDKSLEKCLDDLLVVADKQKRGKKVSGVELHKKVMHVVDSTAQKLGGKAARE